MNKIYTDKEYDIFCAEMTEKFPHQFSYIGNDIGVGSGWWHIIKGLCINIQSRIDNRQRTIDALTKSNPHNIQIPEPITPVSIVQIKEKFGGLRFYYDGGDDMISGMVRMAEFWAIHTCEVCGQPGMIRTGGWFRTLCDTHEAERQAQTNENQLKLF